VLLADGETKRGEDEILEFLERFPEPSNARRRRSKAREEVPTFEEVEASAA
jgi:hypothetical protein